MSARDVAVATILREHRSLERMLHTVQVLLTRIQAGHAAPEFDLICAALYYLDDFQERCHHPKEDDYLFKALSAASTRFAVEIAKLQAAHASGAMAMAQLQRDFVHYQGGAPGGLDSFKVAVDRYAQGMTAHIESEEALLEMSHEVLDEAAWVGIAAAFDKNDDPLFRSTPRAEFGRLYRRIQLHAPRKLKQNL